MATAKKNMENEVVETVEEVKPEPKQKRKFAQSDMIPCRSVMYGELLLPAKKSGILYTWANYGDITEVEYRDLQALRSMRSAYINEPAFVILDEDLVEQWSELKPLYENVMSEDLDKLFTLPINQFKAKLKKFPTSYKNTIKNIAADKIVNGSLDSLQKIKAIDEILGTDLKLYLQ